MKKRGYTRLLDTTLITGVCILTTFIFLNYDLGNQLGYFLAFKQQNLAATSIWESNHANTLGFWRWGIEPSDHIYTSYPAIAYVPKTILSKMLFEVDISTISILLGSFSIWLMSMLMYFILNDKPANSTSLGAAPVILFATNPSLLGIIPEPDWPESFLITSLLGLMLWKYGKKIAGMIAIVTSFAIYFPAALSALVWQFSKSTIRLLSALCSPLKRTLIHENLPKRVLEKCLRSGDTIPIDLFAGIGAGIYFIWRRIAEEACRHQGLRISGSQLLTRIGIDPQDVHYGGLLSIFRFLLPIPNRISFTDLANIGDLETSYSIINIASLAVSHALLVSIGISAGLAYLLRKSNNRSLAHQKDKLRYFLVFYGISTIPLLFFMPQMMSVHFRLTDRLLAPITSVGICIALKAASKRLHFKQSMANSAYCLVISLVTIEQIRFFISFYFPVIPKN